MNLKEILELIDKVADRGISLVEVERGGARVRIEGKRADVQTIVHPAAWAPQPVDPGVGATPSAPQTPVAEAPAPARVEEDESGLHIITSPIVGTFYRSPNPEAELFVNVGDRVNRGAILCIIEAMKLMNEIECDADGTIAKIYPQNAQPVEYGEKLFAVRV